MLSIANIDRQSFIANHSTMSVFSSVGNENQFCDILRSMLNIHAPHSQRKVWNHNSFVWFGSIRDELFKAKSEGS